MTFLERLGSRLGVIEGVGPHPGGRIDRDRAIGGGRRTGDDPVERCATIHIRGSQGATYGRGARTIGAIVEMAGFCDYTNRSRCGIGYNWTIIRTLNRDCDVLRTAGRTSGAVRECDAVRSRN